MQITLTVSNFDFGDVLEQLPSLSLTSDGTDYWLLLPTFEKIEEKTGKLIDLGEAVSFKDYEIELIEDVIKAELKAINKSENEEELLIERDDERL